MNIRKTSNCKIDGHSLRRGSTSKMINIEYKAILLCLASRAVVIQAAPIGPGASKAVGRAGPLAKQWSLPDNATDLSAFSITSFTAGANNLEVLDGSPMQSTGQAALSTTAEKWDRGFNSIRVTYPKGTSHQKPKSHSNSTNPGGVDFHAYPLDLSTARNVSFEYAVWFPEDFDFGQGGVLPGLFGGDGECSGKSNASEK